MDKQRIFIIVGVGRSGTSLLQSMVAAHPEVQALPETSFLRRYAFAKPVPVRRLKSDDLLQRVPGLGELDVVEGQSWSKAMVSHYLSIAAERGKKVVLDKDPRLIEYMDYLVGHFKAVKIIHIFRDPRDVLVSKKRAGWSKGRSLLSYLIASRVQLGDARRAHRKGLIISVRYESLIVNPEAELRSLCDSLEIVYSEEMLNYSDAARKLVQPSEMSWKKETLKPVITDNANKWKSELTPVEAASAVMVVSSFCRENGYRSDFSSYSMITLIKAGAVSQIAVIAAAAYKVLRSLRRYLSYVS